MDDQEPDRGATEFESKPSTKWTANKERFGNRKREMVE
jgi:hypothetical protein